MEPEQLSSIEDEIRETEALEASSAVTDVPHTAAREIGMSDEQVPHTDTGVVTVIDTVYEPPVNVDVVTGVDMNLVVDIDIDTHVDQ